MMRTLLLSLAFSCAVARSAATPPPLALTRLRGGAMLPPADAYAAYAKKGAATGSMSTAKAFHSSVHAGALVGFGGLLAVAIAGGITGLDMVERRIVFGITFPYIMFVILSAGGQLYTGNAGSVTAAYLEGYLPLWRVGRALAVAFAGNVVGCFGFAWVAHKLGLIAPHIASLSASFAEKKLATPLGLVFGKAIVCNWLVCLAILLAGAADDVVGKILASYLPITAFIILGLEHSVANAFMLPLGLYGGAKTDFLTIWVRNLLPVAAGNAVGGALLIAASYSFAFGKLGAGF